MGNNITPAQEARKSAVFAQWEPKLAAFRSRNPEVISPVLLLISEPKIQYDRVKFNRMDYKQQAAYEKKLAERKTTYGYGSQDVFINIPKVVFDLLSQELATETMTLG